MESLVTTSIPTTILPDGKLPLPPSLLKHLDWQPGATVVLHLDNHRLLVEKALEPTFTTCIEFDPASNEYLAFCSELEIATSGETLEEAKEMIADAAQVTAQSLLDHQDRLAGSNLAHLLPYARQIVACADQQAIQSLLGVA